MAGIIVKDRDGNDVTHSGATGVRVRTLDGGTKDFIDGDTVPDPVETTVELDFSAGDMNVIPEDGSVFKKVTIPQPDTLIPENVAEGINIGGIIGTLAAGGSVSGNTQVSVGIINSGAQEDTTIEHGLGVIPDMIIVDDLWNSKGNASTIRGITAFSSAYVSKKGIGGANRPIKSTSSNGSTKYRYYYNDRMDKATATNNQLICKVNTETFTIPPLEVSSSFLWIALTGLP